MYGGPKLVHLDDVPAEEMVRYRYGDGRMASIWEKWIEMSPNYIAFWNKWDPGAMSPHHGHTGDHVNFILAGEITDVHGNVARAGTHIMLEYGDAFGPWIAGPDGCELYGFVAAVVGSGGRAWPGDADLWQKFLADHDAVSEPVPMPKRLPPWWRTVPKNGSVTKWIEE